MHVEIWDIFRYIFKWKFVIALTVLVSFALSVLYVNTNQSYTARIVLEFKDASIKEGKTPDGEKFDRYEIASPDVLSKVIDELSLERSVDSIRSGLTVAPIIPEAEKAMQESKLDDGEKYEYYPNIFSVTYSAQAGESAGDANDILEAVVNNYMDFYISNYIDKAAVNDATFDEEISDYDYLELAESISNRIDETITRLGNYYERDSSFRSPSTGMTFSDIKKEYQHLCDYVMPELFSDIYRGQITKDKKLLIEKYTQRVEEYNLSCEYRQSQADMAKSRMDKFAEANERVPNSYNNATDNNNDMLEVLDDVYDDYYGDDKKQRDTTTTYDELMVNYVQHSVEANNSRLEAEYCENVIEKFTAEPEEWVDRAALTENIEKNLSDTKTKMTSLYKILSQTISDYNDKIMTEHLVTLTGVDYYSNLSMPLYAMILVAAGLFLSVIAAISVELYREYKKYAAEKKLK